MAKSIAARKTPATRGVVNLRIGQETRQLIDDAAASLGKTRTEFMVDTARRKAVDVLLDRRVFVLKPHDFESFVAALDGKPDPDPKLRALLARKPVWEK